jgi:hypothetical protein
MTAKQRSNRRCRACIWSVPHNPCKCNRSFEEHPQAENMRRYKAKMKAKMKAKYGNRY